MTSRVFVIEPTRPDFLQGLQEYGEVVFIFQGSRASLFSDDFQTQLIASLREHNFDPDEDFVAVTGKQVPLFIFAAAVVANYGEVDALMFSSSERRYIQRTIGVVENETSTNRTLQKD